MIVELRTSCRNEAEEEEEEKRQELHIIFTFDAFSRKRSTTARDIHLRNSFFSSVPRIS
jgi:hypothetical protein